MRTWLVLALVTVLVGGCLNSKSPDTPNQQPAKGLGFHALDLEFCEARNLWAETPAYAVEALIPADYTSVGVGHPATVTVGIMAWDCDDIRIDNVSTGPGKIGLTFVPVTNTNQYGDDLTVVLDVLIDSPNPAVLRTLQEKRVPAVSATIDTTPVGGSMVSNHTDYQYAFVGPAQPLVGTSALLDNTRLVFGAQTDTAWFDVGGSELDDAGLHHATFTANKGLLSVIATSDSPLGMSAAAGRVTQMLSFGETKTMTSSASHEISGGVLFEDCRGWNHFYHKPASQVQGRLPSGYVAGDPAPITFAELPSLEAFARMQVFGMTCNAYSEEIALQRVSVAWTSVALAQAPNGVSGAETLNSFGFEWFVPKELVEPLQELGISAREASVFVGSDGIRISLPSQPIYVAACIQEHPVEDVSYGFWVQSYLDHERRFYSDLAGEVRHVDLRKFSNYESERASQLLASNGELAAILHPADAGECQWMTAQDLQLV